MTAEHSQENLDQTPDSESVNHLKDQLRTMWEQLPDEEKTMLAIELLEDMEEGERLSFRKALDTRWPVTSDSIPAAFGLIMITPGDLDQIGLVEGEIELFDDEQLQKMSAEIREHYVVQGFWEELKYHTMHFLGSLPNHDQKSE